MPPLYIAEVKVTAVPEQIDLAKAAIQIDGVVETAQVVVPASMVVTFLFNQVP